MSANQLAGIIERDPEIQGGVPVFCGTRVPVQSLFDHLEAGDSIETFLAGFCSVKRHQVIKLLEIYRAETLALAG
jgi:uncharacterized protein (DUF433 family)